MASGQHDAGQYKRLGQGGREIWIEASYNPTFDEFGRVVKVVKFAPDISARVQAARELRIAIDGLTETADKATRGAQEVRAASDIAMRGGETVSEVVQRIDRGTLQADAAGSTMGDIMTSVKHASELMDGMAKSAVAQSATMNLVSSVITRMDAEAARGPRQ